jgi:NADH/NAD ratio-sensing transcriptional regulator Rex
LDFNQASGYQLINAVKRIINKTINEDKQTNVVLIGHSKTFLKYNEVTLERFLKWSNQNLGVNIGTFAK